MVSYWLAFAWGLAILASFVGWGGALNRVLFPAQRVDWGQRAAWGVALSVVVGGVLNLLQCISRTTVLVYLGLGMACCLAIWISEIRGLSEVKGLLQVLPEVKYRKLFVCGGLLVAALAMVQYAGSISGVQHEGAITLTMFNPVDDFQAYFVFPKRMLQAGAIGPDPFSQRRLEASLGGKSFLDTFVLSMASFQNLHILDSGLAVLTILGLLWAWFKETGTLLAESLGILMLLLLIPLPKGNITSWCLSLLLLLSLSRTLEWRGLRTSSFVSRVFIVAVLGAAICSLKSTFIPACGIFLACSFLCYVISEGNRRKGLAELLATLLLILAFILPWMISMYRSSGTFLYPLLGRGYHQSVYGNSPSPYSQLTISGCTSLILKHTSDASSLVLLALGFVYLSARGWKISEREAPLSAMLGALLGKIAMTLATGGFAAYEYSLAAVLAAVIILLVGIGRDLTGSRRDQLITSAARVVPVAAWASAAFLIGSSWDGSRAMYLNYMRNTRQNLTNLSLVSRQEGDEYKQLQESIPRGEVILTRLDKPFLLDFGRNTIFLWDNPGEASPPPGMPLFRGSEALADYLVSKSIRYVAYSYGDEAGFTRYFSYRLSPYSNLWERTLTQHKYDVQDNLSELGKTRKRIYDDGKNFVLDLRQVEQNNTSDR